MRFRILTAAEKKERKKERLSRWHKWFAWRPVRLTADVNEVRFLERVYRKRRKYKIEGCTYYDWQFAENELDILKIKEETQ